MRTTLVKGLGTIRNNVPLLLAEKFGGKDRINVQQVARDTGLSPSVVQHWADGQVRRKDDETVIVWCHYFGVKSISDLMEYVPPKKAQAAPVAASVPELSTT